MRLRLIQLVSVVALILFTGVASFNLDLEHTLIYQSGNNDDYFGFSIGLHAGNTPQDGKTWLIAGAPKANDTSLQNSRAPGAVFICNFKEQCTKLKLTGTMEEIANKFDSINDRTNLESKAFIKVQKCLVNGDCNGVNNAQNDISKPRDYSFIYNDSMIGSTIDVFGENFLICSPRVKVFYRYMPKYHRMYGFCHLGSTNNINMTIKTIVPFFAKRNSGEFVNLKNSSNQVLFKNVWGQAGFSGTLRKEGGGILLGAPGADTYGENTYGKVVAYETSPAYRESVPTTHFKYRVESESWSEPNTTNLGYSVTTGNYFKQKSLFYVSGAPLTLPAGEVHLFTKNSTGKRILLRGNQYGENFGATLATGDLNNDSFDDLLVGSPQYSSGGAYQNEGKVTVFLGGLSNFSDSQSVTITGKNRNGRFGHAISCIGDIDRDGYDDFAVSEPFYESGAVHVFMGSGKGLILSQIIFASKIHPQLAGFGYSISRGRDMDKNGFADIAIGSYKSGHVVILRTKPVVNLKVNFIFINEPVPVSETELTATFCIFGESAVKLPSINVSYKFTQMDHRLTRKGQGNVVQLPVDGNIHCYNESFNLNNKNVEQSIKVTGNFSILCDKTPNSTYLIKMGNADTRDQADLFDHNCAMSKQPHVVRDATATFQLECKGTCEADLKISVSVSSMRKNISEIVVGSLKSVTLTIVVENSGEPAYNALVEIHSQTDLSDSQCSQNGLTYTCRPEHLLRERWQMRDIEIILEKNSLDVFVRVLTDSQLKNNDSSRLNFSLPFVYEAGVSVFGQQNDSVRYFQPEVKGKQIIYSSFTYEIGKQGPSPLEKVQLSVFIPLKTARNGRFVSVLNRAVSSMECLLIDKDEPMNMPAISAYNESRSTERDFKPNETLIISCNNGDWNCGILQCTTSLPSKIPRTTSFSVTVDIAIDTSKIAKELGKKEMVMIETTATVKVLEPNVNFRRSSIDNPDFYRLSMVLQRIVVKKISLWIYVGAGAGGLLLVFLIIGGLYKAGFFRRKVKEELKVLKRQTQMLLDQTRTEQLEARIASLLAARENEEGDEDDDEAKA